MPKESSQRTRSALGWAALLLGIAVAGWLQVALAGLPENGLKAVRSNGLTQAYTSALAAGQAHLQQAPDPGLLALSNPYDPAKNAGLGLLDVSLYSGRYYLYFGIVPWAVLLVPWFKLTGTHLSDAAAICFFCVGGFLCYAVALFKLWRHRFGTVSPVVVFASTSILAIASGIWPLLILPQMTQIPSAAAYGFLGLAWLGIVSAEVYPSRRLTWLSLALFAAGLTMGCRPNYAPAVALMALWALYQIWRHTLVRPAFAMTRVLLPLLAVGLALAAYNFIRFGHPLEFGFSYQLVAVNRAAGEGEMSGRYLAFNLHRYLFGGARWTDYFPFIAGEAPGPFPRPSGHDASDQVYGLLWVTPVILVGAAAFLRHALATRTLALLALGCGAGNLLLLGAFGGSAYRYPVDYLPSFALAAGVGLFALAGSSGGWTRRLGLTAFTLALGWSAAASLFQVASLYDTLLNQHPRAFALLAKPFNALVYFKERQTADGPRSLRLQLKFPTDRTGQVEPLLVVGPQSVQDFLYVYYSAPGQLRLGFESIGRGGPVGRPFNVDLEKPHTLDLAYGSFLPPDDHPLLRPLTQGDRDLARRTLTVLLDGRPVLDGWSDFHPIKGVEHIGTSPEDPAFGPRFTGTIIKVERPPLGASLSSSRTSPDHYGPLQLGITLRPAPVGAREPLLSLGHRTQGQLFVLERTSSTHVRITCATSGGADAASEPFAWPLDQPALLTINTGGLLPPALSGLWPASIGVAERDTAKRPLEIRLNQTTVWRTELPLINVAPSTVAPGRNDVLQTGIAPTIAADISTAIRLPWAGSTPKR